MQLKYFTLFLRVYLAVGLFTLAASGALPLVSFNSPRAFLVPAGGQWVSVLDFNGDGKPDLAVPTGSGAGFNGVSILLGKGNGTFRATVNYPLPSPPNAFITGDFNGDGKPDLAVAVSPGTPSVMVLLGNGDGTFQPAVSSPLAGLYAVSMAVADFNADGKQDLALVDGGGVVWSLLSNGDGTFQTAVSAPFSGDGVVVAVEDFDGDGKIDLAVAARLGQQQGTLAILRGNGDGTFQAQGPSTLFLGVGPSAMAVADFDKDGKPDLAVTNSSSNTVSILLNNGGKFDGAVSFPVGHSPDSVAVGDFNGDGLLDLAVGNAVSENVSLLFGNDNGSFQVAAEYGTGGNTAGVAVGDFNGDGKLDLVANTGGAVSILLGTGHGALQHANAFSAGSAPVSVAVGDFNGDGKPDLAAADYGGGTVSILLGTGTGGFQIATAYTVGNKPTWAVVGDFNMDGKPDLAVANSGDGTVTILLGNGDGTFTSAGSFSGLGGTLVVADFNGDGKPDLAGLGHNSVSILPGNGDGTFQPLVHVSLAAPSYLAVADFNGDGKADLAVLSTVPGNSTTLAILLGNGDGTFQAPKRYGAGKGPVALAVGDLNGDGQADLAVANHGSTPYTGGIAILLGNGNGTFQAPVTRTLGFAPSRLLVADLNGDGKADVAIASFSILVGNGDGTLQLPLDYAGASGGSIAVGDFDGDGKPDLVAGSSNVSATVLMNNTH